MEDNIKIYEMASEIKKLQRIATEHQRKIFRLEDMVVDLSKIVLTSTNSNSKIIEPFIDILKKI